jgi:formate hydrogenlyase subunit 3/multisubunit Na+/H+ antiporter MnhD subunit
MSRIEPADGSLAEAALLTSRRAGRSPWLGWAGRIGLVAKGVSYALVGVLAIALAAGLGGSAAGRGGALEVVADEFYGRALMIVLAAGFAAYALWRLAQAILDRDDEGLDGTGIAKRTGYLARAVIYGSLTVTALTLLDGTGTGESDTREARRQTAEVLGWPAGRWLVAGVGVGFLVAAGFNGFRAFTQKFEEKWKTAEMGDRTQDWLARIGSIGLLARFVVFGLIGLFLVKAAYEYDPGEAIGLDGALRTVVDGSYGGALLGALAAGLLAYALFCLVEARYRRV